MFFFQMKLKFLLFFFLIIAMVHCENRIKTISPSTRLVKCIIGGLSLHTNMGILGKKNKTAFNKH